MKHKPIPKKLREQVYAKYDGHCAYCGCELKYEDMQVDHKVSVYATTLGNHWIDIQDDSIGNLLPSCRSCNYYKDVETVEGFRKKIENVLMRNVRKPFDYRLAVKYGLVIENAHPVVFYYERFRQLRGEGLSNLLETSAQDHAPSLARDEGKI